MGRELTDKIAAPFGAWPSPITAADVASGSRQLLDPVLVGEEVWWSEARPEEDGRRTVVRELAGGELEDLLLPPWSAHSRVHEYGGASWLPVSTDDGPGFVFVERRDQRVYLKLLAREDPVPLTPEPDIEAGDRYADFAPTPDDRGVVCVLERHLDNGHVRRALVEISLAGGVRELVTDGDFLAAPAYAPDGARLAWIRWNHPDMPWDATELRVAEVAPGGNVGVPRTVMGGAGEAVLQPTWVDDDTMYVLSDRTGWWNLHAVTAAGAVTALCPRDAEFANPMWLIGSRWFAVLDDGRVVVRSGVGDARLGLVDPATSELIDLDLPHRAFGTTFFHAGGLRASGDRFVAVAGSSTEPAAIVVVDVSAGTARAVRHCAPPGRHADWLPQAHPLTLETAGGLVYGMAYPPHNAAYKGVPGTRPPYLVNIHGGPTTHAQPHLDIAIAYYTSRGIGYFDLNHRGSSGYGRKYRDALRGGWGVVDVEDALACVSALADQVGADPDRIAITGRSAGGATTLAALVSGDAFAAGISEYGVADFAALARDTHDFESRYMDRLIAPYPQEASTYDERSALTHVDDLQVPVLLLQGEDDRVVPPDQARMFAAAAAARGLPHALEIYAGEGHGWTKAATIQAATESKLAFLGAVLGFEPPGVAPIDLR